MCHARRPHLPAPIALARFRLTACSTVACTADSESRKLPAATPAHPGGARWRAAFPESGWAHRRLAASCGLDRSQRRLPVGQHVENRAQRDEPPHQSAVTLTAEHEYRIVGVFAGAYGEFLVERGDTRTEHVGRGVGESDDHVLE